LVANLALNFALIPAYGYVGAAWATMLTEIVLGVVGWTLTTRHIGRVPVGSLSWRAILAGLVMAVVIFPMRELDGLAIAIPIVAGVLVYSVAALLLRAITRDELDWVRRALALTR
jgi:O-antigen/teichoic acid export membrane protein